LACRVGAGSNPGTAGSAVTSGLSLSGSGPKPFEQRPASGFELTKPAVLGAKKTAPRACVNVGHDQIVEWLRG
jgi:hypothetical protein